MVSTNELVIGTFIAVMLLIAADYVGRSKAKREEEEASFGKIEINGRD